VGHDIRSLRVKFSAGRSVSCHDVNEAHFRGLRSKLFKVVGTLRLVLGVPLPLSFSETRVGRRVPET